MKFRLFTVPLLLFAGLFLLSCNEEEPTPTPPPTVTPVPDIADPTPTPEVEQPPDEGGEPTEQPGGEGELPAEDPPVEATPVGDLSDGTAVPAPGSTVQHQVQVGEWLIQIARCYGADYGTVRWANPQIYWPNTIYPGMTVTVPNVGSVGEVKGAPCVGTYTVELGDTWSGLAERFGTTVVILQNANPGPLWAGNHIIVPAHNPQVVEEPIQTAVAESTPEAAPAVETSSEPSRIQFAAGATSATVQGDVATNGETTYVFRANEGQQYSVSLAPTQDDVMLTVENTEQTLPAEGVLPSSGDYIIRVRGGEVDATYSLELTVTNP